MGTHYPLFLLSVTSCHVIKSVRVNYPWLSRPFRIHSVRFDKMTLFLPFVLANFHRRRTCPISKFTVRGCRSTNSLYRELSRIFIICLLQSILMRHSFPGAYTISAAVSHHVAQLNANTWGKWDTWGDPLFLDSVLLRFWPSNFWQSILLFPTPFTYRDVVAWTNQASSSNSTTSTSSTTVAASSCYGDSGIRMDLVRNFCLFLNTYLWYRDRCS